MTGAPSRPDGGRESGIRVLHVDDDQSFLDLASTFLESLDEDFRVRSETDVEEALGVLTSETEAVDCVVSDYEMPGTGGLEFLERVRERGSDVPFVLFTGRGSEEVASEAISAGATDYIQKQTGSDQYAVLANRIRNAVDQHRARRALAASQERLSRYIEQSPLGTIEYDETFRIERVNSAAEEILGYEASELVGGTWLPFVPPELHRHVAALERDLLSDKGGYSSVNENVRRDGERIRCAWHNQVVTDDDGTVIRVFSQFEDVTEETERKREIERTNAVLSTVLDTLPVGMLVEDADRRIIRVNERLYDVFEVPDDPTDARGRDCKEFAVEISDIVTDSEGFVERIDEILADRDPVEGELIDLDDGRTLRRTYRPIDLPDGRGHLWIYRDVTDRRDG
ncbi:PAS domain-containing protein [Halorubrum pallidum]|uniref:PAS domain-containing protein n=1 Tax=Halorubrum pallidum TaxID=1526114 RepID=A0ABD5T3A8_9EURY